MKVRYGDGTTEYGPGVTVELTGDEIAIAIDAYLVAHNVRTFGPRTIMVNGELCQIGLVKVGPPGFVIADGMKYPAKGPSDELGVAKQ